ncbi:SCO2525 family SAM-dependent methyltransferase [Paractinoplanes rhizophilus]|uniref:SCO2525 family SAM-dependent methyltransferase n=1 Tax=Paractinoplanes rhizophilus TaxID=1416877 RepID=A0ABW2HLJ4_9ACTN|nr:SCO2525 family SAM-dependent methyltransferase [Actinoplanes sp.]
MGDSVLRAALATGPANDDAPWDRFDSDEYFWHNYKHLRHDDARIIDIVADFFEHCFDRAQPRALANAIDVGSGTNLYPALTMLPFAARVTLFERSHTNRQWLIDALVKPQSSWRDEFWPAISDGRPAYQRIKDPMDVLAGLAWVTKGNVFALRSGQSGAYDLGTMFFVAESITTRDDEFERATLNFIDSLKPGSPFAAAFMCRSEGYYVGSTFFPAYSIDDTDVKSCLESVARISQIERVDSDDLRDGYSGMIVATGWKR